MNRYAVIENKNPREIVLLRGTGCRWKKCTFCDYHLDAEPDEDAAFAANAQVLAQVRGQYARLEVINSGSFSELDARTQQEIFRVCEEASITDLHIESHWMYRRALPALRARAAAQGITLHVKIGVETFDADFRETVLRKGIDERDPARIAEGFDEVCLLFGLAGQTAEQMTRDIELGLAHFDRVCVNLMVRNSTPVLPDEGVRRVFSEQVAPRWRDNPRVDILEENTDFGVGG